MLSQMRVRMCMSTCVMSSTIYVYVMYGVSLLDEVKIQDCSCVTVSKNYIETVVYSQYNALL